MNKTGHKGFTLIELLIVVVIIGILLMVALPSYQASLQKGRRADGMAALMDAAGRQEKYMLDRSTYTDNMQDLGYDANPYISPEEHYSITAEVCDDVGATINVCYKLTAVPAAGSVQQKDTRCTSFVLNSNGTKTATGSIASECW